MDTRIKLVLHVRVKFNAFGRLKTQDDLCGSILVYAPSFRHCCISETRMLALPDFVPNFLFCTC